MRDGRSSTKILILGSIFVLSCPMLAAHANTQVKPTQTAASHARGSAATLRAPTAHVDNHATSYRGKSSKTTHTRQASRGGISCVPYARNVSGIEVAGNAWQWWENAEGHYARGRVPERGSVLAFRSNGRMQLGHVAVVSRVINSREIEVDHANWGGYRGRVAHDVPVVDVSEANNWTAVRVGLGRSNDFGSVYPTYGFIYDRPDNGVMTAHNVAPAPTPELNPVPSDLRPAAERPWHTYEEVAEAPAPRVSRTGQVAGQVFPTPAIDRK